MDAFPLSIHGDRLSLFSWLRDDNHPVAQQVAVQTFAAISTSGLDAKERTLALHRKLSPGMAASRRTSILKNPKRLRRLNPLGEMSLLFMAPRKEEVRALLRPVMARPWLSSVPTGLCQPPRKARRKGLSASSYSGHTNSAAGASASCGPGEICTAPDSAVNDLARTLSRTLLFYRFRWIIVADLLVLQPSLIQRLGVGSVDRIPRAAHLLSNLRRHRHQLAQQRPTRRNQF